MSHITSDYESAIIFCHFLVLSKPLPPLSYNVEGFPFSVILANCATSSHHTILRLCQTPPKCITPPRILYIVQHIYKQALSQTRGFLPDSDGYLL